MLKINNVSKFFQSRIALNQINLNIDDNLITGVAGHSGSGKSTMLRCIQGLEKIDEGSIYCDKKSTFMFQDFQLFPHMNVLKNLTYAPKILGQDGNLDEIAENLLAKFGLQSHIHSYPGELSGGQKQRVALCRNLILKPDLLLCDEPTSGLDTASIDEVVAVFESIQMFEKVGIIITSHNLEFLTKISQRIIVLKDGDVVADINTKDLANAAEYLKQFY